MTLGINYREMGWAMELGRIHKCCLKDIITRIKGPSVKQKWIPTSMRTQLPSPCGLRLRTAENSPETGGACIQGSLLPTKPAMSGRIWALQLAGQQFLSDNEVSWKVPFSCLTHIDFKKWSSILSQWQLCLTAQLKGLRGAVVYKQCWLQWMLSSSFFYTDYIDMILTS